MGQQLNVITGLSKQEEAIDFIREHEPPEGYFLGFSGGKDSTVLKHLAELSGVKFQSYYSATGIDPPEVVHFIKKYHPEIKFLKPKKSFYKYLSEKGFPTRINRWCCDYIKEKQTKEVNFLTGKVPGMYKHRLMGIRAEESFKRSKRAKIDYMKNGKFHIYKPLFQWTEYDIWDHIERYSLQYCTLYDEGHDRLGCVVCPFLQGNMRKIERNKKKWPGIYAAFERAMYELWENREWYNQKAKGRAMLFEEFLDNWYKGK